MRGMPDGVPFFIGGDGGGGDDGNEFRRHWLLVFSSWFLVKDIGIFAAIRIGRAAAILAVWLLAVSDQLSANSSGALPNLRHFYVADVAQNDND